MKGHKDKSGKFHPHNNSNNGISKEEMARKVQKANNYAKKLGIYLDENEEKNKNTNSSRNLPRKH